MKRIDAETRRMGRCVELGQVLFAIKHQRYAHAHQFKWDRRLRRFAQIDLCRARAAKSYA